MRRFLAPHPLQSSQRVLDADKMVARHFCSSTDRIGFDIVNSVVHVGVHRNWISESEGWGVDLQKLS